MTTTTPTTHRSLSARRAWIEISDKRQKKSGVALSLSARRAWIEMSRQAVPHLPMAVALRKESVDRNPTDVVSV